MKTSSNKLTKRDLFRANWRWLWASQLSWNYEKMMAPGYFYSVLPFLKRWYPLLNKMTGALSGLRYPGCHVFCAAQVR